MGLELRGFQALLQEFHLGETLAEDRQPTISPLLTHHEYLQLYFSTWSRASVHFVLATDQRGLAPSQIWPVSSSVHHVFSVSIFLSHFFW